MKESAEKLDFEKAQSLKNDILSIKSLESNQIVRDGIAGDCDVLHFIEKYDKTYIGKIEIIASRIS
jgi:excinuclease UvrABC nuclease subunit